MLALGGLRAGFGRGAGSIFKEIAEMPCEEGFRKNEAEVVSGGSEELLNGVTWSAERLKRGKGSCYLAPPSRSPVAAGDFRRVFSRARGL